MHFTPNTNEEFDERIGALRAYAEDQVAKDKAADSDPDPTWQYIVNLLLIVEDYCPANNDY